MPQYRVYELEADGRVTKPAHVVECADDHEAIAKAKEMKDGKALEVWDGSRRIVEIP